MSKETFKAFVRNNPSLIRYVNNNSMTWQKFYEMYELYGENNSIWNRYFDNDVRSSTLSSSEAFKELASMFKNLNLEKVQKGINNVQKTISLIQDLGIGSVAADKTYEARPTYQHFDD